jgi:hypothetical protein
MKNKNHDRIIAKAKKAREKNLENKATEMLKKMEQMDKLREKQMKGKFLDLF